MFLFFHARLSVVLYLKTNNSSMIFATWSPLTRVAIIMLHFLLSGVDPFPYATIGQLCSRPVCSPAGDDRSCDLAPKASSDLRCLSAVVGAHTEEGDEGDWGSRQELHQPFHQSLDRRCRRYPCTWMGRHRKLTTKTCVVMSLHLSFLFFSFPWHFLF